MITEEAEDMAEQMDASCDNRGQDQLHKRKWVTQ